jgi:hypothetical protein
MLTTAAAWEGGVREEAHHRGRDEFDSRFYRRRIRAARTGRMGWHSGRRMGERDRRSANPRWGKPYWVLRTRASGIEKSGSHMTPCWREPDSNPRSRASVSTGASGAREATHAAGREARMASVADSMAKLPCLIIAVSRISTRQAATLAQGSIIFRPVRYPILLLRNVVTAIGIGLEWRGGHLRGVVDEGSTLPSGAAQPDLPPVEAWGESNLDQRPAKSRSPNGEWSSTLPSPRRSAQLIRATR